MNWKPMTAVFAILLIFIAAGVFACFYSDDPRIEFDRPSYDDLVVEYGSDVPFYDVTAVYRSKIFHRVGFPVPVTVEPTALPQRLGEYTIRYRASCNGLTAEGSYKVRIVDTVPPELTVDPKTYACSCRDNVDGDLTAAVVSEADGPLVTLRVSDSSGNTAELSYLIDVVPPVITLGEGLLDYACTDETDGDLTDRVQYYESGGFLYYTAADDHGNTAEVSRRISGGSRVVYLTFDDGPGPYTEELLDILNKYNVKATFFVVGCSEHLDLLPRIAAEGHTIAAHSYSHNYKKIYASEEAYFDDLARVQQAISEQIGRETKLIRFPGGSSNTVSRSYCKGIMSRLVRAVAERGCVYFDWNVSSGDAGATTSTQTVIANVKNGVLKQNVAVVLQHDVKDYSVAGVEEIIRWGLENGFVFLPLTERSTAPHHGVSN